MEAGPRHVDSLLAALAVAADDLEPRRLRGYGELDPAQQETLHRLAEGLRRLFETLREAPAGASGPEAAPGRTVTPIGVIRSPWTRRGEAPRQPPGSGGEGRVELRPDLAPALADLDGFERIWLLYLLDRSTGWTLRATPPLDTRPHGLFATRSPNRPNPIGLSCVRLLGIEGAVLRVAGLDVLDGTPLLDIKPYIPGIDAWPGARAGWVDHIQGGER
ncbi:MAG TPA: tRNA (N6-threonylcarbamoyladenosine(37)-N6)-methyltransferase TrmO [Acidobacteria bacterium]|nr:tRNA (N6-threonylcarbamoyladenosine(37)-N6)-methyltransferase TrmO [Acidobacteriota bacterium]